MTWRDPAWPYAAFYCEENAWQALDHLKNSYLEHAVLWILGRRGQVALWQQRLAMAPTEPVVWDYHVIALARASSAAAWLIFDPDSVLPFATRLSVYLEQTFPRGDALPAAFQVRFRWFEAGEYRRRFHSTRAHMQNDDGTWREEPPPWPPLCSQASDAVGVEALRDAAARITPPVLTLTELLERLAVRGS